MDLWNHTVRTMNLLFPVSPLNVAKKLREYSFFVCIFLVSNNLKEHPEDTVGRYRNS